VFKDQRDGNKAEQPGSLRVEGSADRAWAATDRRWQSAAVNGVIGPIVVAAFLTGGLSVGRSPAEEPAATPLWPGSPRRAAPRPARS